MTTRIHQNPFEITKASDFSDAEILETWVESLGSGRLIDWLAPRSPVPMLVLGGKGSGKTHLMRYLSLPLQRLRHRERILDGIRVEGFIGVYLRCSGLNAGRFAGKGVGSETWSDLFAQYFDLWLTQLTLQAVASLLPEVDATSQQESAFCADFHTLFSVDDVATGSTLEGILAECQVYQRAIDNEVNNASLVRSLRTPIRSTPGALVFGVPVLVHKYFPLLADSQILYLIDELENLDEAQQRYVNTLIRERSGPSSVRVGARTWGIRTYGVLNSQEENKRGSEFEVVHLDEIMRQEDAAYEVFCRELVISRLLAADLLPRGLPADSLRQSMDAAFFVPERSTFGESETAYVHERETVRPYWSRLSQQLKEGLKRGLAPGVHSSEDIETILSRLQCPEKPLVEKGGLLHLYREWSDNKDLMFASATIQQDMAAYVAAPREEGRLKATLDHFRADLLAQLRRDFQRHQQYLGMDIFVSLSSGLPRNLLILLKCIYKWAEYNGEVPFGDAPITEESQRLGVLEASRWFYSDSQVRGQDGDAADSAIKRLATLFRSIRYSDKPSECSLIAFSIAVTRLSASARRVLDWAENRTLLVPVPKGQRHRNKDTIDEKYQLNSMLCPRWDLPAARRGAIEISTPEAQVIFSSSDESEFISLVDERVGRMSAPSFGRPAQAPGFVHPSFPGLDDD